MRRILAQSRKELIQLARDWRTLGLALLLPIVLLVFMSTAISFAATNLPIVVQDLDSSPASRNFIDAFRASITFHIAPWPESRQPEKALESGAAHAVIIIPRHFGRNMVRSDASVQLLIDASDANTARLISGYAGQIARAYNRRNIGSPDERVHAAIRLWYNPGRSSRKFFGPGIFVLALSMFPPLLASMAMAREVEQKTILQVYVSNIGAHEFLLGKIFAFVLVALAECVLMLILLLTNFGMSFAGDATPFWVATALYAFCVASFGIMIGSTIPSQVASIQVVAFGGFLLVFLLSGLMFPIENIPAGIRWISIFVWGKYYIEIVRDALLSGSGWSATWPSVVVIGLIGGFFYLIAWLKMQRMQLKE